MWSRAVDGPGRWHNEKGVVMELSTVILGIIVVGAIVAAVSYAWTQKGVRRNVENEPLR
jgi:hypothetical protein